MPNYERGEKAPGKDLEQSPYLAWLKDHITVFWPAVRSGYEQGGRGAIVINTTSAGLGEDTPFHYSPQALIEAQEDETSLQLAEMVSEYDPKNQFVAVFIRPGVDELEFSLFQIRIGEALVKAAKVYDGPDNRPRPAPAEPEAESTLEPPDLETLMAWADEGGCEAACPHSCWIEPDGTCTHGHPSWLLKLGLI